MPPFIPDDHLVLHAMTLAYQAAATSPDPSTQNGACLICCRAPYPSKDEDCNPALVSAHNAPIPLLVDNDWSPERRRHLTTHAEEGCILMAAHYGIKTAGSTLVAVWACCEKCATQIIRAGITTLIVDDLAMSRPSHWDAQITRALTLLREEGIEVVRWTAPSSFQRPPLLFQGVPWHTPNEPSTSPSSGSPPPASNSTTSPTGPHSSAET